MGNTTSVIFDETFFEGFPYKPTGFFVDRLVEVDQEHQRIVCEMGTEGKSFPLINDQRHHDILYPPHLPGGIIIHLTGIIGMIAAQILLDFRFDKGWAGYGSRIHKAEFKKLVRIGPVVLLEGRITSDRRRGTMAILRYEFRFFQEQELFYLGDQTAVYRRYRLP